MRKLYAFPEVHTSSRRNEAIAFGQKLAQRERGVKLFLEGASSVSDTKPVKNLIIVPTEHRPVHDLIGLIAMIDALVRTNTLIWAFDNPGNPEALKFLRALDATHAPLDLTLQVCRRPNQPIPEEKKLLWLAAIISNGHYVGSFADCPKGTPRLGISALEYAETVKAIANSTDALSNKALLAPKLKAFVTKATDLITKLDWDSIKEFTEKALVFFRRSKPDFHSEIDTEALRLIIPHLLCHLNSEPWLLHSFVGLLDRTSDNVRELIMGYLISQHPFKVGVWSVGEAHPTSDLILEMFRIAEIELIER